MEKEQVIELYIDSLAAGGEGIGRWNGMAVFVSGALPGETVRARVNKLKKSWVRAGLEEVLISAPDRVTPECSDYPACGGCHLQHLAYAGQLRYKRQIVEEVLARIGNIKDVPVLPVLGMDNPRQYRNKIHLHAGGSRGNIALGFYAPGSHRLVSSGVNCLLAGDKITGVITRLKRLLDSYGVGPGRPGQKQGMLRSVTIRSGETTGQVMVVLVTGAGKLEGQYKLARDLMQDCPEVVSVVRNITPGPGKAEDLLLGGREYIIDELGGIKFKISPHSFYQVNPAQTGVLYAKAGEYAGLTGGETVVDAYCGIGTIALYLARQAARVVGLESVAPAVADAKENARLNGIENAEFKTGPVEKLLPALAGEGLQPGVVVLDPPRQGCAKEVLQAINDMKVPRVVYVSCDPATLARDLGRLQETGYRTVEVQPVDMFPWTAHVECTAVIEREAVIYYAAYF